MDENNNNEDNKKRNKIILIILWILLAIFIILFVFGNGYIFLSKDPSRSGNTISTDTTPEEDENNTTSQETSSGTTATGPYSLHTGNQGDTTTSGTTNNTGDNNNNGDNNNPGDTGDSGDGGGDDDDPPQLTPEEIEKVKFLEGDEEFKQLPHLDIFNDTTDIGSKIIYPGLSGIYKFNVENFTDKNIEYKLSFIEENPKNVNMKFKLQRNGTYIGGNDSEYVSIQDICKEDLKLDTMMGDVYILHWKWVDSPNDIDSSSRTERGNYKLTIEGRV